MIQQTSLGSGAYMPPDENMEGSVPLIIAPGCYLRCSFCTMYIGGKPSIRPVAEVKADIDRLVEFRLHKGEINKDRRNSFVTLEPDAEEHGVNPVAASRLSFDGEGTSLFLQDADIMHVPTNDLVEIMTYAGKRFGDVEHIASYATAYALARHKTPEELQQLRAAGLKKVYVGLESGHPVVLKEIIQGKHATPEDMIRASRMVMDADIELCLYVIAGIGGKELSGEHADATADVLNTIQPHVAGTRSLMVNEQSPLRERIESGKFTPLNPVEVVEEQLRMVRQLEFNGRTLYGHDHPSSVVMFDPLPFPEYKGEVIDHLEMVLSVPTEELEEQILVEEGFRGAYYREHWKRGGELEKGDFWKHLEETGQLEPLKHLWLHGLSRSESSPAKSRPAISEFIAERMRAK